MSLAEEYRRQFAWRDWTRAVDALPLQRGDRVLDLGCAVGDQAELLAARGARVIGIDANAELLAVARARNIERAEFRLGDLTHIEPPTPLADGIWCSFAAAYFVDLERVLRRWSTWLRPNGWIALVEIDDLFGHVPLPAWIADQLERYADDALEAKRYDFRMGRKLSAHLERAGFALHATFELRDAELNFDGRAPQDVLDAWGARLDRMQLLRAQCGTRFDDVRRELLDCLSRDDHRSTARVVACVARRA